MSDAIRQLGVSEVTFYRWRKEYGGMNGDQLRGPPAYVRSDNGPEFVAEAVRRWIDAVGAKTAFIEPGSPWENGYIESFNARLRDELLEGEIFYSLKEAASAKLRSRRWGAAWRIINQGPNECPDFDDRKSDLPQGRLLYRCGWLLVLPHPSKGCG